MSGGLHFEIGTGNSMQDIEHVKTIFTEIDSILKGGRIPSSRYRLVCVHILSRSKSQNRQYLYNHIYKTIIGL